LQRACDDGVDQFVGGTVRGRRAYHFWCGVVLCERLLNDRARSIATRLNVIKAPPVFGGPPRLAVTTEGAFVVSNSKSSCPFCTLPAARIVAGDALAIVIRDGFPVSPGHTLIVPRRHVASIAQASADELHSLWAMLAEARRSLDETLRPAGYNIGINDGIAAGQTVMHLHVHLIPRFNDDRADPRGGVRWVIPEKADYWSDVGRAPGA
jgi:diadenosine tetraphosphate (Ap4A) HIT family hydrolase